VETGFPEKISSNKEAEIVSRFSIGIHDLEGILGLMAVAFDEMNGLGGDLRPAYQNSTLPAG